MLTLQQVYDSSITDIISVGQTDIRYARRVNDACRRLTKRGDFIGPIAVVQCCVNNGCVVWPRHVHQIRKINCCNRPVSHRGVWHDWMPMNQWRLFGGGNGWSGWSHNVGIVDRPNVPTFSDIWGEGRAVRVYPQAAADIGKTIQLFGEDNNGQPLRTQGTNGAFWTDGITLTLAAPYAESTLNGTPYFIRRIDRVIKQVTQMPVTMFACQYTSNPAYRFGSVYNLDTGGLLSVTALGEPGSQYLELGDSASPLNSTVVGYLYNTDSGLWQSVVGRGLPGSYYLEFGLGLGTATANGGMIYNETTGGYVNLTLQGQVGGLYPVINSPIPAPIQLAQGQLEPLATYSPGETNPGYLRTNVRLGCTNGSSFHSVAAIVKLRHIDAVAPTDVLVIDNIDALKLAVQALQYEESGEKDQANEFWSAAIEDLNREVQATFPEDEFEVHNAELERSRECVRGIGRQRVF